MLAQEAIAHWREANRVASESERELSAAWMTYFNGTGPMPTEAMAEQPKRLRALADEALHAAMVATGARKLE
jgi:hypothetical protein